MKKINKLGAILMLTLAAAAIARAEDEKQCLAPSGEPATAAQTSTDDRKTGNALSKAIDYNERGVRLAERDFYEQSLVCFRAAIALSPGIYQMHYNLGTSLYRLHRLPEAVRSLQKALEINGRHAASYYYLSQASTEALRYAESLDFISKALEIEPQNADFLAETAMIYYKMGNLEQSEQYYRKSLAVNPRSLQALNDLGVIYFNRGEVKEATELFRRAVAVDPQSETAHNNLGAALTRRKKYREALAAHLEAVRLKPDWSLAVYNLGLAYLLCKNKSSALATHKTLQNMDFALARRLLDDIHRDKVFNVAAAALET